MFPFSIRRTIKMPIPRDTFEHTSEIVVSVIYSYIKSQKPYRISSTPNNLQFTGRSPELGGLLNRYNWSKLVGISSGNVQITPGINELVISYTLWFTEIFILASVGTAIFGYLILSEGITISNIGLVVAIWLYFYGGNLAVMVIRFHSLINSAIKSLTLKAVSI
jgi:hypothetical protein